MIHDNQNRQRSYQQTTAFQMNSEYDLVIIGAGSAGTLLANRLCTLHKTSELSILILETGSHRPDDPNINTPGYPRFLLNNPEYDWRFASQQEPALDGRRIKHPRGKVVGGTSAINSHSLVFPSRAYHDFWNEKLLHSSTSGEHSQSPQRYGPSKPSHKESGEGYPGVDWSWEGVAECYSRPFEVQPPDMTVCNDLHIRYDAESMRQSTAKTSRQRPDATNTQGASDHTDSTSQTCTGRRTDKIQASFPRNVFDLQKYWIQTFETADFLSGSNGLDGQAFGGLTTMNAVDARSDMGARSHAGRQFWETVRKCPNVTTRENILVEKIEFSNQKSQSHGKLTACGVHLLCNGQREIVRVKRSGEVILCAGVFNSPHILELSGIGARDVLADVDVQCNYDLPGVGENLQDHLNCGCSVELKEGVKSRDIEDRDQALWKANITQYETAKTGPLADGPAYSFSYLPSQWLSTEKEQQQLEKAVTEALDQVNTQTSLSEGIKLQHQFIQTATQDPKEATATMLLIPKQRHPDLDVLPATEPKTVPGDYVTIVSMLSYPFSRGSCHTVSKDAATHPQLKFNYLSHPLDKALFRTQLRQIDRFLELPSISHIIKPNGRRLPRSFPRKFTDASDAELDEMLKATVATNYHPCGTCAMMREELGGVVDETFKVYGTTNVRIVDASVIPLVPRGNILTTVYALAEKAAEVLLEEYSLRNIGDSAVNL